MRKLLVLLMITCFVFSIFAQGASESAPAADKVEDTLDVYSIMPEKAAAPCFEQFTKDTGIKVNFVRLSSGEALSRLIAEKDNPQVDALWGGPSDTYDAGIKEGIFMQYTPKEADKVPANYQSPDHYWTGIGLIPLCFLTNTDFLKKNNLEAPQSWEDLCGPAYKNGLQMADARTSGTATERIYAMVLGYKDEAKAFEVQKEMNKNIQLYTKSGAGGALPVANGQAAAGVFYLCDALDIVNQGYPVVVSYPKQGVTYGVEGSGIVAGCKHPNAAKALMDWASTKALGSFMMANKICYVPTRPDIEVTDPNMDLSKMPLIESSSQWKGENRARFVEKWENEVIK